jgi:hypothetical protein
MWVAPERGTIRLGYRELETFWGRSRDVVEQLVDDLSGVADIILADSVGNIVETHHEAAQVNIKSRRMVREEHKRKQGLEADRRYREQETSKKRPKNVVETSGIYQKSEVIYQKSDKNKNKITASPSGFAEFWTSYPRIKRKSKGQAEKAWKAINPDITAVLAGLDRAKRSTSWLKDSGQYIPYPATWLRARGWEDEDLIAATAANNGRGTTAPAAEPAPRNPDQQRMLSALIRDIGNN